MNGLEYIKSKQRNWATRKGFTPIGGTIPNKGEKNYLEPLTDNLYGEHITKESQDNFNSGDGNETKVETPVKVTTPCRFKVTTFAGAK